MTLPQGAITLGYHPTTRQLETVSAPGGVALGLDWGGFLLEGQTWSGSLAGTVSFGYEQPGLRLASETIAGTQVDFGYDDDGLLTQAGAG